MGDFSTGALIGAAIVLVVIGFMLMRPPPAINASFGGKRMGFSTTVSHAAAYRAVAGLGQSGKLKVARSDEGLWRVLLADGLSWTSWGFYYPVDFSPRSDGGTDVTIGIKSKAFQWGPFVTMAHKRTTETVRGAIERARA